MENKLIIKQCSEDGVRDWDSGMPIGNGRLGAMISGNSSDWDRISLNHDALSTMQRRIYNRRQMAQQHSLRSKNHFRFRKHLPSEIKNVIGVNTNHTFEEGLLVFETKAGHSYEICFS